ncbi:MAG: hypothetical protein VYA30_15445 [Myxococcota bacterium]|nr:hypothetical protein [Myxococcota bacterium]
MKTLFRQKSSTLPSVLIALSLFWAGCAAEEQQTQQMQVDDMAPPGPVCDFDESDGLDSAKTIAPGTPQEGFICPVEDQDWFSFSTGTDDRVVVQLEMTSAISAVSPSYGIVNSDGDAVATGSNQAGVASGTHCVEPGRYSIVVRDSSNAYQDLRNPYRISIETGREPDEHEPNQDQATATPLAPDVAKSGFIACDGDADWYAFEIPGRFIVTIELTMDLTTVQPRIQMLNSDGELVQQLENRGASREATELIKTVSVTEAGQYFFKVTDASGRRADSDVPYQVRFSLTEDADLNEPNDKNVDATPIAGLTCGEDWTDWVEFEGTFGVAGDVDWFRVPLTGCDPGLIEAEILLNTDGLSPEAAAGLQAAIGMVRLHGPSTCEDNASCLGLNAACENGWGCAGYGNQCINGQCAGTGECMTEGQCGALQLQRAYDPSGPPLEDGTPAPHRALISAPIFGDEVLYLRVSDFGGDTAAPRNPYRLRVRTRAEPDQNEPSNVYMPDSYRRNQPVGLNRAIAVRSRQVPVHLCGGQAPTDPCLEMQPACNNQVDDDGDGQTDYPFDPGCSSWTDATENDSDNPPQCANGEDDDLDGEIDYPLDPDCTAASSRRERNPSCPAGVDLRRIADDQQIVMGDLDQLSEFGGSCGGAGGRERVYALRVSYPSEVTVTLDAQFDGVVYGLYNCSRDSEEIGCAANGQELNLVFEGPGIYFLVVDSVDGTGPFTLNINRRVTVELCDNVMKDNHDAQDGGVGTLDAGLMTDTGPNNDVDAAIEDSGQPAVDAALDLDANIDLDAGVPPDQNVPVADSRLDQSPQDLAAEDAAPNPLDQDRGAAHDAQQTDIGSAPDAGAPTVDAGEPPRPPIEFVNHCCGTEESDWIEGSISYEYDQDWYAYRHPCPGEDCMVRIVFQLDGGSVDHLMQVYTGNSLWFDTVIPVQELPMHPASSGRFGGLEQGDQCFYAFSGHGSERGDYLYVLSIRDLLPARDWNPDQKYRFCVEKIADGCHEPPCRRVEVNEEVEECSAR